MQNTGYNKLQLVLIAVKDWGEFSKVGGKSPQTSRKTLDIEETPVSFLSFKFNYLS